MVLWSPASYLCLQTIDQGKSGQEDPSNAPAVHKILSSLQVCLWKLCNKLNISLNTTTVVKKKKQVLTWTINRGTSTGRLQGPTKENVTWIWFVSADTTADVPELATSHWGQVCSDLKILG